MNALLDLGLLTLSDVAELLHCSKAHVCKTVSGRVRGCPPVPAVSLGRRKLMRRKRIPLSAGRRCLRLSDANCRSDPANG
jgi:hypothetical protein